MGGRDFGPRLQELSQRLEVLTEWLGGLERENARLQGKVATLEDRGGAEEKPEGVQGQMGRRTNA